MSSHKQVSPNLKVASDPLKGFKRAKAAASALKIFQTHMSKIQNSNNSDRLHRAELKHFNLFESSWRKSAKKKGMNRMGFEPMRIAPPEHKDNFELPR
jgi:hypothetical protein